MKIIINILIALIMFGATILGATAFELDDNEDTFEVTAGDTVKGAFVTDALNPSLETDFPWINLNSEGDYIANGQSSYTYEINVPNDADIGIYRGVIKISDASTIKYLNIKISVQNGVFSTIFKGLDNPVTQLILYMILGLIILIILVYQYVRVFNNG